MARPKKSPDKQEKKRDDKGKFVKGKSGNPKGRPKKDNAIADILNTIGNEVIKNTDITKREAVLRSVYARAVKGENWAVNFIADRTEGKALERVKNYDGLDELEIL